MLNRKMLGMVSLVGALCATQYGCSRDLSLYEKEELRLAQLSGLEKSIKTQDKNELLKQLHEEQRNIMIQREMRRQRDRDYSLGCAIPTFGGLLFLVAYGLWEQHKERKLIGKKNFMPPISLEHDC